jgi:hypothetical protein
VFVETDLNITGRPAQFGRGIMEDVATRMLEDFAKRLEQEVSRPPANGSVPVAPKLDAVPADHADAQASPNGSPSQPASAAPASGEEPLLDLGDVIAGPLAKRGAVALAVLLIVLAVLGLGRRRPRGLTVTVSYR